MWTCFPAPITARTQRLSTSTTARDVSFAVLKEKVCTAGSADWFEAFRFFRTPVGTGRSRTSYGRNRRISMTDTIKPASRRNAIIGWILSGLVGAFLVFSASFKFLTPDIVRET